MIFFEALDATDSRPNKACSFADGNVHPTTFLNLSFFALLKHESLFCDITGFMALIENALDMLTPGEMTF